MYTKSDIESGRTRLMFGVKIVKTDVNYAVKPSQLQFRRTTARYGKPKGSFSSNLGYIRARRDAKSGKFVAA